MSTKPPDIRRLLSDDNRWASSSSSEIPANEGSVRKRFEKSKNQYLRDLEERRLGLQQDDELCGHYWVMSTMFPLTAATLGPIANVMSICALVYPWRVYIPSGVEEVNGLRIGDPDWVLALNAISLACGFLANLILLLNLAKRIDSTGIYARPATIVLWFLSATLLLVLVIAMGTIKDLRILPQSRNAYSQSFYYAIIATALYFCIAWLLIINVAGGLMNKYPRAFNLTVPQRTLMLQTMSLMAWICLGAGVFSKTEGWIYIDGIYFCVVTVLTIGLGDLLLTTTGGRVAMFFYASIGIIMVGLVIGSIRSLVLDRARQKIERRLLQKERESFILELEQQGHSAGDDKSRFNKMREIQERAEWTRRWIISTVSVLSFLGFWLVGAAVFMVSERSAQQQGWTYFESLYFAFTCLLAIGYGDFHPTTNSSRPFFVIWAMMAVPALTILISSLEDTIIAVIKDGTIWLGEFTILPENRGRQLHEKRRLKEKGKGINGLQDNSSRDRAATWSPYVKHSTMHHQLALALQELLPHLTSHEEKQFGYDEWKKYRDLFDEVDAVHQLEAGKSIGGDAHGAGRRDWMAEDSPLMATLSESEWLVRGLIARLDVVLKEDRNLKR